MTTVQYVPRFVTKEDFNEKGQLQGKVVAVTPEQKNGKNELVMTFEHGNNEQSRMSIWGLNLKSLITAFGNETDNWVGGSFLLTLKEQDGKWLKVLDAIPRYK